MEQPQPLVCPTHKSHYFFIFIITLVLGGALGAAYGYQKGFFAAKKLVTDSPMGLAFVSPDEVMTISGLVTAIQGNSISIQMQSTNPFDDQNLLTRTVTVNQDTKIVKVSMGDPAEMQAQMEAFMKAIEAGKTSATPPMLPEPTTTTIAVSAINVGDTVTATAVENIKLAKSFIASEVRVQ